MALSVVLTRPWASRIFWSRSQASTGNAWPAFNLRMIKGTCISGTENTTAMGWVWVMLTKPLGSLERTKLPNSTCFKPSRPLMGAVTRV